MINRKRIKVNFSFKNAIFIFLLFFLMIGAVSAANDSNGTDELNLDVAEDSNEDILSGELADEINGNLSTTPNDELETDFGTISELKDIISSSTDPVITLDKDYQSTSLDSEINIARDLTVDGAGHKIDFNGRTRIMTISNANVTLKNIVLLKGNSNNGGAIFVSFANLTLINCALENNSAVQTGNYGGGAIFNNFGNVTIINSTLANNTGQYGGAIYNSGNIILINTTIQNNEANRGKAIYNGANKHITLINTTLTNNNIYNYAANVNVEGTIDFLTTKEIAFDVPNVFEGNPVNINIGIDGNFDVDIPVTITNNNDFNTVVIVKFRNGHGNASINLPLGDYTASIRNSIKSGSVVTISREFSISVKNSFKALNGLIQNSIDSLTLDENYIYEGSGFDGGIHINKNFIIHGNGKVIDANGLARIFYIDKNAQVTLENMTILNGCINMAGAIMNEGSLTIINSTISNNVATGRLPSTNALGGGAILNNGYLRVVGSSFNNNSGFVGGAIFTIADTTLIIENSSFSNNTAEYDGGVIYSLGILEVWDSTFINNTVQSSAAILNSDSGSLKMVRSSFINNTVIGENYGVLEVSRNATIINSTFINNPAKCYSGVYIDGWVPLLTSDEVSFDATNAIVGNPIHINITTNEEFNVNLPVNITNNDDINMVVVFKIRNGKASEVLSLPSGRYSASFIHALSGRPTVKYFAVAGEGSFAFLNNVIQDATDFVTLECNYTYEGAGFENGIIIDKNLTISGNGKVIDGAGLNKIFTIAENAKVTLENITLKNGYSEGGGAITNLGHLTIINSLLENNGALYSSGAIENGGNLTIINSTLSNNYASNQYGGAISSTAGHVLIINSNFFNNTARNGGGAIFKYDGTLSIDNSNFTNNTVIGRSLYEDEYGGGAILNRGDMLITNSLFEKNNALKYAGAIHNLPRIGGSGNAIVRNAILKDNQAYYGGAVFNDGYASINLINDTLKNNTAGRDGGAFYNTYGGFLYLIDSRLEDNNAESSGDAGYLRSTGHLIVINTRLISNKISFEGSEPNLGRTVDLLITDEFTIDIDGWTANNPIKISIDFGIRVNVDIPIEITQNSFFGQSTVKTVTVNVMDGKGSSNFTVVFPGAYNATFEKLFKDGSYKTISKSFELVYKSTFDDLNRSINNATNEITLGYDYRYEGSGFPEGIIINKDLKINGNGKTIDARGLSRIFKITNDAHVTIENITLINGNSGKGGAIYNEGSLVISGSTLENNNASSQGGAIYNEGSLVISGSTLENNNASSYGGAIYNMGSLVISGSTLQSNTAQQGGAIRNYGNVTITNSTIKGNRATRYGGVIYNYAGNILIINTLMQNNIAGTGGDAIYDLFSSGNSLTLVNATLTNNNIRINGINFYIEDTVLFFTTHELTVDIAEGFAGTPIDIHLNFGANVDADIPIRITSDKTDMFVIVKVRNGEGTESINLPMGYYGVSYSTIRNNVYVAITREFQVKGTFTTLKDLIDESADSIVLENDFGRVNGEFYTGVTIDKDMTIDGNGRTIDGSGSSRIFNIASNAHVTIKNLNLINGYIRFDYGGAINNDGYLTIINSTLDNNKAGYYGGAIYNKGVLTLINSTLENNQAMLGNAVFNVVNGQVTLLDTTLTNNRICNDNAELDMEGTVPFFTTNEILIDIPNGGDGIPIKVSVFIGNLNGVVHLNITNNDDINLVLAIEVVNGQGSKSVTLPMGDYVASFGNYFKTITKEFKVHDSTSFGALKGLIDNAADRLTLNQDYTYEGEGFSDGIVIDKNITIDGNGRTIDAMRLSRIFRITSNAYVTMENMVLINGLYSQGGAIYNEGYLTLIDSTLENNRASEGAAVYNAAGGHITLLNTTLNDNKIYNNKAEINRQGTIEFLTTQVDAINIANVLEGNPVIINITFRQSFNVDIPVRISGVDQLFTVEVRDGKGYESIILPLGGYSVSFNDFYKYGNSITKEFAVINHTAFSLLNELIINPTDSITLEHDYIYEGVGFEDGIVIDKDIVINGNGKTIDARGLSRIFKITNNAHVTIENIILKNGKCSYGGAINNEGTLTIINSTLRDNKGGYGGAIFNDGTLTIIDSKLINNEAINGQNGGAIYNRDSLTIINSTLDNNKAGYNGGAIDNNGGTLTITDSILTNNRASSNDGGAIYNQQMSTTIINNSTFANNTANDWGGAIRNEGKLTINASTFENNTSNEGGAVYNQNTGDLNVTDSLFKNNTARGSGGAIANEGKLTVDGSWFENNKAPSASSLRTSSNVQITIANVKFRDNEDNEHSVVCIDGQIDLSSCKFQTLVAFEIANISDFIIGDSILITVQEINNGEKFNGIVAVSIGGESYLVEIRNGTGTKTVIPDLGPGKYAAKLSFAETDNYYADVDVLGNEFKVTKNPKISIGEIGKIDLGQDLTIYVTADAGFNEELVISINNKNYPINVQGGFASITIPDLPLGTYKATINYPGNENYSQASVESNEFRVAKNPNIGISAIEDIMEGSSVTIYVTADTSFSDNVTVTIGDLVYVIHISEGSGNKTIDLTLNPGTYKATVSYPGNDDYHQARVEGNVFTVTAKPVSTQIYAEAVTTVYNGGKYLVITLKDSEGIAVSNVNVSINFNGIKTLKTDKNGQIKLSTNNLAPKTYNVGITFEGYGKYLKSSASTKVIVKKAKPKLTAKKKTFKAKVKTKKYVVTLKDNRGKAMKKVKLTLKIKGKTFKAKTNSKGKATFKIKKLNKKAKYKAVIKFAGNAYYTKVSKKVKIVLK